MISKNKIISTLIGVSFVLFLLDFPLIGPFTTSRLGFLFFLLAMLRYSYSKSFNFRRLHFFRTIILSLILMIISVILSSVYNMIGFETLVTWFFILIVVILLSRITEPKLNREILKKTGIASLLFLFILVSYSVMNYGILAFMSRALRYGINELGPGLSRIVNGVVIANIYILLAYQVTSTKRMKFVVLISLVLSYWFILSSHSRQGFLLLTLLTISYILISYSTFKYKRISLVFLAIIACSALYAVINSTSFTENFLDRTTSQLDDGKGSTALRMYFYEIGWQYFTDNMFFGIGSGNFLNYVGFDSHSSYIKHASENGILSLLGISILLIYCFKTVFRIPIINQRLFFLLLTIVLFASPIFNTLINSPMFWITVVLILVTINQLGFEKDGLLE